MKIIDTYLLRQFLVPLVYCLLTFTLLFVVVDLFDHLSDFIEAGTPIPQAVRFYLFLFPALVVYIAPISLLLAILYSLWQLTRHNEITALRAGGVSLMRLVAPLLAAGVAASVGVSVLQETVAPWSSYWAEQFIERLKSGDDLSTRYAFKLAYKNERRHREWVIQKFDRTTFEMEGVNVVQLRPDGSKLETIVAESARPLDGRWWLFRVQIRRHDFDNNPVGTVREEARREMTDWTETPRDFVNETKQESPELFLSSLELRDYLRDHKKLDDRTVARLKVNMHWRLAMPWTCLVVIWFGIPCGLHTARRGALTGMITALASFFAFYALMMICKGLGNGQLLTPWVSAWAPNLVFLLIGVFLVARAR